MLSVVTEAPRAETAACEYMLLAGLADGYVRDDRAFFKYRLSCRLPRGLFTVSVRLALRNCVFCKEPMISDPTLTIPCKGLRT